LHGLHLPDAVLTYLIVALALAFPVVVTLAWAFDLRAGKLQRTPTVISGTSGAPLATIVAGVAALVSATALLWYFMAHGIHGARRGPDDEYLLGAIRAPFDHRGLSPGRDGL
jgi:hypothetical protein